MTREDATKILKQVLWLSENIGAYFLEEWDKEAIRTLIKSPWISVSERLPEDGRYLCDYGDCIDFGQMHNGKWFVDGVIAWMPLPEPYKTESEEEE